MHKWCVRTPKLFDPLVTATAIAITFVGNRLFYSDANATDRKALTALVIILMIGVRRIERHGTQDRRNNLLSQCGLCIGFGFLCCGFLR